MKTNSLEKQARPKALLKRYEVIVSDINEQMKKNQKQIKQAVKVKLKPLKEQFLKVNPLISTTKPQSLD